VSGARPQGILVVYGVRESSRAEAASSKQRWRLVTTYACCARSPKVVPGTARVLYQWYGTTTVEYASEEHSSFGRVLQADRGSPLKSAGRVALADE
jgi:hypothetical protein